MCLEQSNEAALPQRAQPCASWNSSDIDKAKQTPQKPNNAISSATLYLLNERKGRHASEQRTSKSSFGWRFLPGGEKYCVCKNSDEYLQYPGIGTRGGNKNHHAANVIIFWMVQNQIVLTAVAEQQSHGGTRPVPAYAESEELECGEAAEGARRSGDPPRDLFSPFSRPFAASPLPYQALKQAASPEQHRGAMGLWLLLR